MIPPASCTVCVNPHKIVLHNCDPSRLLEVLQKEKALVDQKLSDYSRHTDRELTRLSSQRNILENAIELKRLEHSGDIEATSQGGVIELKRLSDKDVEIVFRGYHYRPLPLRFPSARRMKEKDKKFERYLRRKYPNEFETTGRREKSHVIDETRGEIRAKSEGFEDTNL
jgi:hypothetical protein